MKLKRLLIAFLILFCSNALKSQNVLPEFTIDYTGYWTPSTTAGTPFYASYTKDSTSLDSIILSEYYYTVYRTLYWDETKSKRDTFLLKLNSKQSFYTGKIFSRALNKLVYVQDKVFFDYSKNKGETFNVNLFGGDTSLSDTYVVDSIKNLTYSDNKIHKTIYYHWTKNNFFRTSYNGPVTLFAIEGIGFSNGFLPFNQQVDTMLKPRVFILQCAPDTERYYQQFSSEFNFGNKSFHFCSEDQKFHDSFFYRLSLGVKERMKLQVLLFPNPARGEFQVAGAEGVLQYCIYDLAGKMVVSGKTDETNIIQAEIKPGLYFVHISDALKRTSIQKIRIE